jgi:hypothetical protein
LDPAPLLAALTWPQAAEPEQATLPPPTPPAAVVRWPWRWPQVQWPSRLVLQRLTAVAATVVLVALVAPRIPWKRPAAVTAKATTSAKATAPSATKSAAQPAAVPASPASKPQLASLAPVSEPAKPAVQPTLTLLPTQPLELVVTARSSTWLQVRADGKLVSQQRLGRGATERWQARKRLEVIVAKPSQVDLSLNDQPIASLAIAHQGRLLITHQGVTRLPDRN